MSDAINNTGLGAGIKSFSLGGLASGLDTSSIINRLMEIESVPITRLQKSEAQMNAKLAMYQEMNSKVLAVKTASEKLAETDLYRTMGASTADTSIFTSTADKTAAPGSHEVVVKQLGTSSVRASSGSVTFIDTAKTLDKAGYRTPVSFVSRTVGSTSGEGGAFTINGTTVDYWKTDTLDDVINRINSSVSGVTASYDSKADKLILTKTGGGSVQISDTVGNFAVANGFANNQVGSGSLIPNTRAGKTVRADMKLSEAFTTPVGDGVMSINGVAIAVKKDETIQQLIDKINRSGANVTASFSTTENAFKLTGKNMGSTDITMGNDSSGVVQALRLNDATTTLGQSTVVRVDGVEYQRNSLKLTDVIQGVTLDLKKATPVDSTGTQQPIRVTITRDSKKLETAISEFVDAFNAIGEFYEDNTGGPEFNGTQITKAAGALLGDSNLSALMFSLKRQVTEQVSGLPVGLNDLSDLGVTLGDPLANDGSRNKLTFDPEVLAAKLRDDPEGVEKLFTQKKSGLADTWAKVMKSLVGSPGAVMDSSLTFVNSQIQETEKRITTLTELMNKKRLDYIRIYTNMEQQMSQIQNQGNTVVTTLNQQLAVMGNGK